MKSRIRRAELDDAARALGLTIQKDCGGFRVAFDSGSPLFPRSGICSTATARECSIYLEGVAVERRRQEKKQ